MALSFTARLLVNAKIFRSERIFNSLSKSTAVYECAKNYINSVKKCNLDCRFNDLLELVHFPRKTFRLIPNYLLKEMIDESMNLLKENGKVKSIFIYNAMMDSKLINKINFDVDSYLQEIVEAKLTINTDTFDIIIRCYANEKRISDIEDVLAKMQREKILLLDRTKYLLVSAFITAGAEDKTKAFIESQKLNENSVEVLVSKARGYADLGDYQTVYELLEKIKSLTILRGFTLFNLYHSLIKANVSETHLEKLVQLMEPNTICDTILSLNQDQFYNNGLHLLEKNAKIIDRRSCFRILQSFNAPSCPLNTYKQALNLCLPRLLYTVNNVNIFCHMDFDDALDYAIKNSLHVTGKVLSCSLINKAISNKSVQQAKQALEFSQSILVRAKWHSMIQGVLIDSMIKSQMVKNTQEILNLFDEFRSNIIPDVYLYHIGRCEFSELDRLKEIYGTDGIFKPYHNDLITWKTDLVKYISLRDIPKVAMEARKMFGRTFVNRLLSTTFTAKFAENIFTDSQIDEAVKLAKELEVEFEKVDFIYLNELLPQHTEIFKELRIKPDQDFPHLEPEISPVGNDEEHKVSQPDENLAHI